MAPVFAETGVSDINEKLPCPRGDQNPRKDQKAKNNLGNDLGRDAHQPFGAEDMRLDHPLERVGNAHQQPRKVIRDDGIETRKNTTRRKGNPPERRAISSIKTQSTTPA